MEESPLPQSSWLRHCSISVFWKLELYVQKYLKSENSCFYPFGSQFQIYLRIALLLIFVKISFLIFFSESSVLCISPSKMFWVFFITIFHYNTKLYIFLFYPAENLKSLVPHCFNAVRLSFFNFHKSLFLLKFCFLYVKSISLMNFRVELNKLKLFFRKCHYLVAAYQVICVQKW